MDRPSGSDARPRRLLTFIVIGMVVGLLFLLLACGLIGWNYLVAPVPRSLAIAAVALGAVSATVILIAIVAYGLTARQRR